MPRLKIYKASAGSGKTFQLVREFLLVVMSEPQEYKHILAVTFTNKSTAEMKDRIIRELGKLSNGADSDHLGFLMDSLCKDEEFVRKRAKLVLQLILHDYSHFSVSTIDRFFQKLIRSFARDIGLSAGYSLEMDTSFVLNEAIDRLVSDLEPGNSTSRWVLEMAMENVKDGKSWNFREALRKVGAEVFKEKFQFREGEILSILEDEQSLANIHRELLSVRRSFESQLRKFGEAAIQLKQKYGVELSDFSYGKSSFFSFFLRLKDGELNDSRSRFYQAAGDVSKWHSAKVEPAVKDRITSVYHGGLHQLVLDVISFIEANESEYLSVVKCLDFFYQFVLVADLLKYIRQYLDEQDTMLISDTAAFISQVMGDQDESFVFEKVGTYYHHYLIDEFQDTSVLQWNNFKPLLSNSVSQDFLSMVVGDVKQSIYRFRNGDWKLLLYKAMEEISYHDEIFLEYNHRSDSNIIRFNNTIFDQLPRLFASEYKGDNTEEAVTGNAAYFTEAYRGQEQKIPEKKDPDNGYVEVKFIEKGESEKWSDAVLPDLANKIDEILSRGYKPSDLVLLVRDSKEAAALYQFLTGEIHEGRTRFQYDLITEKSLLVSSSPVVKILIAALQVLNDRRNEIYRAQVKSEFYLYITGLKDNAKFDPVFRNSSAGLDPADPSVYFFENLETLQQLSLHELGAVLVRLFHLDSDRSQALFLQRFQDALVEFMRDHEVSLSAFLDWWELHHKRLTIATPESVKAILILTIHKSKGLEFPVVILPFCNWAIDHQGSLAPIIWTTTEDAVLSKIPVIPVRYSKELTQTVFRKDYYEERMAVFLDNLNLTYVAFTRAAHELHVYCEAKDGKNLSRIDDFVYTAIQDSVADSDPLFLPLSAFWDEKEKILRIGEKPSREAAPMREEAFSMTEEDSPNLGVKVEIQHRAFDLYERNPQMEEKINRGNLVHEILFRLTRMHDLDSLLQLMVGEGKISSDVLSQVTGYLRVLFGLPGVSDWFDKELLVFKERRLLGLRGEILIPDRIVCLEEETIVIDFKTGTESKEHHEQVKRYMEVLREMKMPSVKGFLLYTSIPLIRSVE